MSNDTGNPEKCVGCGAMATELCGGLMCRTCHVSLTFDECVSDAWVNEQRIAAGLPPMPTASDTRET